MAATILVVDDEKDILDLLTYNLEKEGYVVRTARNGAEALVAARQRPDLCILDVMMPQMDGWEVCKALRRDPFTSAIPVMFLTARDHEADEVLGLELGADDYVAKPVRMRTLLARVKKVLARPHRTPESAPEILEVGGLRIHVSNYRVDVDGKEVAFPKKEFEVLLFLVRHPDRVISRETLLNEVWGRNVYVVDRTVDVHIRKIREKLHDHADAIETVKGVGYRFVKALE
jgi:two-component system, OmpR family, alkaline phosphatase synthesis response regulator PhoP